MLIPDKKWIVFNGRPPFTGLCECDNTFFKKCKKDFLKDLSPDFIGFWDPFQLKFIFDVFIV